MVNQPTPRTYAKAAYAYNKNIPSDMLQEVLAGYIGEGRATELKMYLTMAEQLPDHTQIFMNPTKCPVPTDPSAIYAMASSLAYHIEESSFEPALVYMDRIVDKNGNRMNEFQVMLLKDLLLRKENISKTKTFQQWATNPANMKLLSI